MKYLNYLFLILLFFSGFLEAQELPPIEKFTPEIYGGENQNWMISQAPNKFIYVANNEGLLEYNGAKWKMYPSPNNSVIRAVHVVGELIYTGCYMEFGFWKKDAFGKLNYKSLIPKLKESMVEDEHIWNIITYEEWILFQSFDRIYFYNTVSEEYTIINSDNLISKVFNIKSILYYHVMSEGIYKIEGGTSKLIVEDFIPSDDRIVNMFPIQEGFLIQSRKSGFYKLINNKVTEWNISAKQTLNKMNVFNSIQLEDKSFILGTISNGIIYLNKDGEIEYQINQNNGLSNNTALCLFEDADKNIWVGLDNGINCINIKSPIRIFNDDKGNIGTVYASIIFKGFLYLGSNQGLFFKKLDSGEPFKIIKGTEGQVWSLFLHNNELFCGHHLGAYIVHEGEAEWVFNTSGIWNFRPIPNLEHALLLGSYSGLNILVNDQGNWKLKNKIEGFDNSARYFEIMNDNDIWISHGYKGVFKLTVDNNYSSVTNIFKDTTVPIAKNSSLVKYRNRILYAYENGVFGYDTQKYSFIKDTIFSPIVIDNDSYMSGKLVVDDTQKLWAFSYDNISYVSVNDLSKQYKINKIAIPAQMRKGMIGFEIVSHLHNSTYLLGTANGYITLDLYNINTNNEYKIILNSIALKTIKEKDEDIDIHSLGNFGYKQNSIVFNYSVPEYNKYQVVKYQYKLTGRYNEWSEWINKSDLIFENLSFGNYNFEIRAKIGNILTSNTISYDFIIKRPFYLSNTAIIVYLFTLLGIILITHKTYKRYYKKQHEHKHLESEQLIIRIKNEKLNQAIENKNRELAISTMSIIKKNEVLSSIKKELKSNHQTSNTSVIRLIDSNINNKKDWLFFEEAFNNVDKDFLHRVKNTYPDLTPNDLRFCAYLRLNLSSKEIAPLLNISVRSVETKRYRLRKRMNLEHDKSLVNHILEI